MHGHDAVHKRQQLIINSRKDRTESVNQSAALDHLYASTTLFNNTKTQGQPTRTTQNSLVGMHFTLCIVQVSSNLTALLLLRLMSRFQLGTNWQNIFNYTSATAHFVGGCESCSIKPPILIYPARRVQYAWDQHVRPCISPSSCCRVQAFVACWLISQCQWQPPQPSWPPVAGISAAC
jgi:hypothetical protein